MQFNESKQIE